MKKIFNWIKLDYMSVSEAWGYMTHNKMPKWARIMVYVILFPLGVALWPFVTIVGKYLAHRYIRKLDKELKEMEEAE